MQDYIQFTYFKTEDAAVNKTKRSGDEGCCGMFMSPTNPYVEVLILKYGGT